MNLQGRSLLKEADFTKFEFLTMTDLAEALSEEKRSSTERESSASMVFDQGENRLPTIKAAMVATVGD